MAEYEAPEVLEVAETQELVEAPEVPEVAPEPVVDPNRPLRRKK